MDTVPRAKLVAEKAKDSHRRLVTSLENPKILLGFMVGVAVVFAVIFIIYNSLSRIFGLKDDVVGLQKQNQKVAVEEVNTDFDKARSQEIDRINSAVKAYYTNHGAYPPSLSRLVPDYLIEIPKDPETEGNYGYRLGLNQQTYELWTVLENGELYSVGN